MPTLKGTILADNPNSNCGAGSNDLGFNISDDGTCGFGGTSLNNSNPKLDPGGLLNNGGPTATIALLANSPAINRIPVAKCTDQETIPQPLGTDQRLFPRPDPGNLNTCDSGAYEFGAVPPIALSPKNERVQISRSGSSNSDQVNMSFTFQYNGDPDCDLGPGGDEDALNNGVGVALVQGTCAELPDSGLFLTLEPFAVHTVNHESYGTLFQKFGTETVSARMVALPVPTGVCGAWTLNLEVAGLNTGSIGLGGGNPFALLISDLDDAEGCFDINNAIVGNQIPVPTRAVRRGVRR